MSSHRLKVSDITVSYHRIPAIHHLSLEIGCGNCVALIGPNGAGKTTFLKALAGLLPLETGSIDFHGHTHHHSAADFAYLPQRENVDWDFPVTVRDLVDMGRYQKIGNWGSFSKSDEAAVSNAIQAMQLQAFEQRQISALSGGQQQRAFLARSLAQDAHVFLLDEPFTGLDKNTQANLGELLSHIGKEGKLVIASHHDLKTVPDFFNYVILLNGELIAAGPTDEVFNEVNIKKTFETRVFAGPHHGMAH